MVKKKIKSKPKVKKKVKKPAPKPKVKPLNKLELLKEGCRLWDRITTKAHAGEYVVPKELRRFVNVNNKVSFYSSADYNVLKCKITGSLAELTVGSSSGHKAKLNLDNHTLEYFDPRQYNNWTMWKILKPLKCNRDNTGVHCKGVKTKAQVLHVFRAMAMPTSMDFRQSSCENDHTKEECSKAELKLFMSGPKHTVLGKHA